MIFKRDSDVLKAGGVAIIASPLCVMGEMERGDAIYMIFEKGMLFGFCLWRVADLMVHFGGMPPSRASSPIKIAMSCQLSVSNEVQWKEEPYDMCLTWQRYSLLVIAVD